MKTRLVAAAAGLLVLSRTSVAFAQCAMCKTLLTNSPEGRAISGRFNVAILVMLFAPYIVTSGVLLVVFRDRLMPRVEGVGVALHKLLRPLPRSSKNPA
jgi:hypothetical protein